jgi:hypothetical protein
MRTVGAKICSSGLCLSVGACRVVTRPAPSVSVCASCVAVVPAKEAGGGPRLAVFRTSTSRSCRQSETGDPAFLSNPTPSDGHFKRDIRRAEFSPDDQHGRGHGMRFASPAMPDVVLMLVGQRLQQLDLSQSQERVAQVNPGNQGFGSHHRTCVCAWRVQSSIEWISHGTPKRRVSDRGTGLGIKHGASP